MSWFPLPKRLMEDSSEFKLLTPTEKLYFWLLVSEYNLRGGEFYKSDLEFAVTLSTSEKTIQRGRKKLVELGWVEVKPGTLSRNGQGLATTYLRVEGATIEEDQWFAQMHRYTFNALLHRLRQKDFQAPDIVVYVYLRYWYWKNRNEYRDKKKFFISKRDLCGFTNMNEAPASVVRLYESFTFNDGSHLFEYRGHQKLTFSEWGFFDDPDNSEQTHRIAEGYINDIQEGVKLVKKTKQSKQEKITGKKTINQHEPDVCLPFPLQLDDLFLKFYKSEYGRMPNQKNCESLKIRSKTYGADVMEHAIISYFIDFKIPPDSNVKTHTLNYFLDHLDEILKESFVKSRHLYSFDR